MTPPAVLVFAFDPVLHLGDRGVRLETLGVAGAVFVVLTGTLIVARHGGPGPGARVPGIGGPGRGWGAQVPGSSHPGPPLAPDDLLFIALGVLPGALVGGRLGYLLLHLDYYQGHPDDLLAPARGGLELAVALVGGLAGGTVVARLLEAPVGRWLHAATIPVLAGMALGKAAMALGGTGQGAPADLPWATAYLGSGPWGSLAPEIPSHPAQLYEAGGDVLLALLLVLLIAAGAFRRRDGLLAVVALAGWSLVRFVVAFAWRDATVLGPLRADQVISLGILGGCLMAAGALALARRREAGRSDPGGLGWPDPELAALWRAPRRRPDGER